MTPSSKSNLYLVLAIILLIASIVGVFRLYRRQSVNTISFAPTPTPYHLYESDDPDTVVSSPAITSPSPDPAEPTPLVLQYTGDTFKVTYPSYRKMTVESESSGQRYVFYSADGNITLHVGSRWSWSHPGRTFNSDFTVASLPTFRYDITSQTIVDFEDGDLKYTIQCVHHDITDLKAECDQFVKNFQLL